MLLSKEIPHGNSISIALPKIQPISTQKSSSSSYSRDGKNGGGKLLYSTLMKFKAKNSISI
jgi:hypothetical protein